MITPSNKNKDVKNLKNSEFMDAKYATQKSRVTKVTAVRVTTSTNGGK
jgi:hypothetical protein